MSDKVSILIPCFNAEKWIKQSIQSALDQSYGNKEVIVVDDASTDRSLDTVKSFGDLIRWESVSHRGGNAVRNRLLELAMGDWVQYLDADDYLMPGKISGQVDVLKMHPQADVIYSPVELLEDYGAGKRYVLDLPDKYDFIANFIAWGPLQTGGALWKKSSLLEVGGWKEDQKVCQEHELMLRMIQAGKSFVLHDESLAVYRYTENASVSRKDKSVTVRERMRITDALEEDLIQKNKMTTARRKRFNQARFESARNVYEKDKAFALSLINKIKKSDHGFVPQGPAAPALYRWAYRLLGFKGAQRMARASRVIRGKSQGVEHV